MNEVKQRVSKVFGEKNKEKIYHDIAELLKIKNMVKNFLFFDKF